MSAPAVNPNLAEPPGFAELTVIGGGPAGSTVAALAARGGRQVVLLEKDRHPRFHIGESLLPRNLAIFERLGVLDRVRELGVFKPGADFTAPDSDGSHQSFRFADALDPRPDHAFQVRRSEFDQMLFQHAARCGASTFEEVRVRDVHLPRDGDPVLELSHGEHRHLLQTHFVVDASGRDTLLARKLGLRVPNRRHGTAAMFAHFRGVPRRPGKAEGNISIYWFDEGWIWMIPLRDGVMSVGAVCNPDYLRDRGPDLGGFFDATLQRNPHAWERMRAAEAVSEITVAGNYSYRARVIGGRRWLMVGDAYAFVDPVFSSGVYLGMQSALSSLPLIEATLSGASPARLWWLRRRYRRRVDRGLLEFSWFIYRFPAPALRHMFLRPRDIAGVQQAVISLLAGDVFDNRPVRWRLALFRSLYLLFSLRYLGQSVRALRQRRRNAAVRFDAST